MSAQEKEFQHESLQDTASVVAYLRALAEGFEKGAIQCSDRETSIELEPAGLVSFDLRVSRKRDRVRLTVRFGWKESAGGAGPDNGTLQIVADTK